MSGRTGTVLFVSVASTDTCTETVDGSISSLPASIGWPSTSTAISSTGSLKSIAEALMFANATTRLTRRTIDDGPRTSTVSRLTTGSPISRPAGTALVSTCTGTDRTSIVSSSTRTVWGVTERTSIPSLRAETSTSRTCGSGA